MINDKALKLAIEALLSRYPPSANQHTRELGAITTVKQAVAQPEQDACGWQFYAGGKWHTGMEVNDHRANTEAAGIPTRNVYPGPVTQPEPKPQPEQEQTRDIGVEQDERVFARIAAMKKPPERPWVGLTVEERESVLDSVPPDNMGGEYYNKEITAIAIAIEAKLKEKNT